MKQKILEDIYKKDHYSFHIDLVSKYSFAFSNVFWIVSRLFAHETEYSVQDSPNG